MACAKRKKLLLIFNPKSGVQNFPGQLFEVVNKFTEAGFLVTVYPTQAPGDVARIITDYAENYGCLVCSGGDGTVSEALDSLMSMEKRPVFGLIPSGTVNDYASSLGIPKDIPVATDIVTGGTVSALDIGCFGGKYFSYVAAFGGLTDVPYATPQNAKNLFGKLAYLIEGIKRFGSARSSTCKITLDGETLQGDFVLGIVGNAHSIAGIRLPTEMGIQMDDGLFEVILVRAPHSLKDHQEIISSLLIQEPRTDLLTIRKAKKVEFVSAEEVAWTLDGDFGGKYAEVAIENIWRAFHVLTPTSDRL